MDGNPYIKLAPQGHSYECSEAGALLIIDTMKERGLFDAWREYQFGSWWYCEFRSEVAHMLDVYGEILTKYYINTILDNR